MRKTVRNFMLLMGMTMLMQSTFAQAENTITPKAPAQSAALPYPTDMVTKFTAPAAAGRQKQWVQRYVANAKATVGGVEQVLIKSLATNPTPNYDGNSAENLPGALIDMTSNKIRVDHGTTSFTLYAEGVKTGSNGDGLEWTNQWAFIDWGQSGTFTNLPASGSGDNDPRMRDGYTRTITIPTGTASGIYRMYIVYNEQATSSIPTFFTTLDNGRPQIKNGIAYAFDIEIISPIQIDVVSSNIAWGTVSGSGRYVEGAEATLSAMPQQGYSFVNWTNALGAELSKLPTYKYTVGQAATITGNFKAIEAPKTVTGISSDVTKGTVSLSPVSANNEYDQGAVVVFTATPASNFQFVEWLQEGVSYATENPLAYTGTTNLALKANFAVIMWNVTLVSGANGSVAYASGITADGSYQQGTSITVTATPSADYQFANWTNGVGGPALSTSASYTFALSSSVDLVANFVEKSYCTLTYSPGYGNGTNTGYIGQMVTLTTTGALADMSWTNPQTDSYHGALLPIASGLQTFAGQTVSFSLASKNTAWGCIRIYVDMNNDKEFAEDECIHRDTQTNQPSPLNKSFTMAAGAKPGMSRMRVIYSGGDPTETSRPACGAAGGVGAGGGYYDFDFEVLTLDPQVLTYSNPASGGTFVIKDGENVVTSGSDIAPGTALSVVATPSSGFKLKEIRVNGAPISGTTFSMPSVASTVSVSFIEAFTVTYSVTPSSTLGTLTIKQGVTPISSGDLFESGTQLMGVIDLLNVDATIKSITLNGETQPISSSFSFTVTQNVDIVVALEVPTFMLTFVSTGGGSVTATYSDTPAVPLNTGVPIARGGELLFTFIPGAGETLISAQLNGTIELVDSEYFFENQAWIPVTGDIAVSATFSSTGISDASAEGSTIYATNGIVYSTEDFVIYNFASQVVATGKAGEGFSGLSSGIYIVKTATSIAKVVL